MELGETIASVAMVDSDGMAVKSDQYDAPFVLYFYPRADTPGCTKEGQGFTEHGDAFQKLGCSIIGVSKDKPAKLAKFKAKYDLSVTLLSDEESDLCERMGVWVEKNMYGKKYMGIERATFLFGKDGRLVQFWRKVKVKGHVEAVLEAAQTL